MFQITLKRWIRWSDDENNNLEFVVWTGTRRKEARGQIKAHTHSIKEMMEKHGWSDGQRFDPDRGILQYWDDEGVWFEQTFEMSEVDGKEAAV